jgi:hypothetical protein
MGVMQTFLPYPDFSDTARCLDYKRLGKQRVEAWQIYQCLTGQGSLRWKNHPAVRMWDGYENCLLLYGVYICEEWIKRGYKDTMLGRFELCLIHKYKDKLKFPEWLGNDDFHDAMKSNLLRKDKKYYSQFGWKVKENLPYIWGNK